MDEYRENAKKVQKALNQDAAFIQPDPYLAQRVLNTAKKEGETVVKKKMPIALIIALVLMLSGIVAVAATLLWQDYVPEMKQTEHEIGDYVEWPTSRKIQLAKDLVAMGYLTENEDTKILTSETAAEEEKAAASDRLMLALTGLTDVKEIHSHVITYAVMGNPDTWTPEQRVWWNGIVTMYGDDGATDTLIVPPQDTLSEKDAVRIAREALQEAYGFDDAYMDSLTPVADMYVTDERPDYKRWNIAFKKYREGSTDYEEKVYTVIVDENGEVISDPDIMVLHPKERVAQQAELTKEHEATRNLPYMEVYRKYFKQQNAFFWEWPYAVKASYSAEMIPLTAHLESLKTEVAETLVYRYGVPGVNNIQYDQALQIAQDTICGQYGLSTNEIKRHSIIYEAYDITDSENPKWKFMLINPDDFYGTRYRVQIDANTGDVVLHEQFPWKMGLQDQEYDMKFY